MNSTANRLKYAHNFAMEQGLYPILLSTILVLAFYYSRAYLSRDWVYRFLPWNLFLAWVPYLAGLAAAYLHRRRSRRWRLLLIPALVWLAFFPNAPYLVTDLVHLDWYHPIPIWYDIVLLSAAAWTGLFLAVFSLRSMQQIVQTYAGSLLSWGFVGLILGLTGLGVYLGRFLRWNSWDLLVYPARILTDISDVILPPNLRAIGFILQVAAFMLVCYLTLTTVRPRSAIETTQDSQ